MPTSKENAQLEDLYSGTALLGATGPLLYGLTLAFELLLGASTRWLVAYLGAALLGAGALLPLGLKPEGCAWAVALAPIVWSILGFLLPGRGWVWGRRLGLRRPSRDEKAAIDEALDLLRSGAAGFAVPASCRVLDDPLPSAAVRGRVLILSRPLVESDALAAVIAHELGHLATLDGRITEALNRLSLWDDPLAPSTAGAREGEAVSSPNPRGALPWALLRFGARLTGGSIGLRVLAPAWAAYWRSCEYAADAYAASLGQAEDLGAFLRDQEQPLDLPSAGIFDQRQHPPVALRIERLQTWSGGGSI